MKHVIIGAGPAGVIAAETLRQVDSTGTITLIGDEPEPPYSRMAIPYLLAEKIGEEGTYLRHGKKHYDQLKIGVHRDRATAVSADDKTVSLKNGDTVEYDRLLIATGAHTIRPPIPGMDLSGVENCWTLADARKIAERAKPGSSVVLMGAGFIGCIVLEALAARKVKLTVVEMEDRMLPRMMDQVGGDMIKRWCEQHGVQVYTGTRAQGVESTNGKLRLSLASGDDIDTDLIVCATGVQPNIQFLEGSGVKTDLGILVDKHLRSSVPEIYAAGDVAQGPDFSTGKQEVHAIQPTASEHGKVAALSMADKGLDYRGSLSMNVLNTLGLISSSFGLWSGVDGGDHAAAVDNDHFKYLRLEFDNDVVVGALALGLTNHVGVVRGLVQSRVNVGKWKDRLIEDPHRVMDAYLECVPAA
ncbi:MAG: NAD(P)/FAD-dependent oxidoreductase [Gammaproteobacteria bacterium]|nr:NAD(P)/FAD-dependent oxidoreductase [Gammaproteobacteria bacterium]